MLVVPVGGGGLCSGQIIARDYLHAHTEIIGAEPLPGNDAARSVRSGQLISNEQEPDTVADGARTLSLGTLNWEIIQRGIADRSEEHTSELQSHSDLVCRLLLEKKKNED